MALKKVIGLEDAVKRILRDYEMDVTEKVSQATKKVVRAGAKKLREESKEKFGASPVHKARKASYYTGWTSQISTNRRSAQGVIYNAAKPGLVHLLENGHAKRGGGRVRAYPHVAPVEEEVRENLLKEIERII